MTFTPPQNGIFAGTLTLTDNALNQTGAEQQVTLQGPWQKAILSANSFLFGSGVVGSFAGNQFLTISNPGNAPLQIGSIAFSGPNAADFSIDTSNCGAAITAQSNCSLDINFTPQGAGSRTASLVISDNAADSPQVIALSGTGLVPANLVMNPSTLTFGGQAVGTTSVPQAVTLTNTGGAPLTLRFATLSDADFVQGASNCPFFEGFGLAAGASCTVPVSFAPKQNGNLTGLFTVSWTDARGPYRMQTATVSGVGADRTQVPGLLRQISVGADGTVWGINSDEQIYLYNAQTLTWQNIPGALSQIAVGSSGAVWGLNAVGSIYRWNASAQTWDWIPGALSQIAVGADGDVWGLNSQGQVWHFDSQKQTWNEIPGILAQIAVGFDGAVWGLNPTNQIFRFNPGLQFFQQVPGSLMQIAVGADGDVWGLNSLDEIYHFNPLTQSWDQTPGWLAQISVGSAGSVWGVNAYGNVFRFSTQTQSWVSAGDTLSKISATENGAAWGLDGSGNIYQY